MIGVAAHTKAGQLTINVSASGLRAIQRLKHEHARTITENEPVAVASQGREARSGSSLRVDKARAAAKPPIPTGVVAISAPPTSIASTSPAAIIRRAEANVMGAGRAGGDHCKVGSLQVIKNRQIPGDHVDDGARHKKGDIRFGPF